MNDYYLKLRTALLGRYEAGEAQAIALLVMEEVWGLSRTDLFMGKGNEICAAEAERFENILAALVAGRPVQQVLGVGWFGARRFKVTPDTLVPRPETLELVALALAAFPATAEGLRVMDAGTGTGCIAITVKAERPAWNVAACDISEAALAVAEENAAEHGAAVRFFQHDMLKGFEQTYDLILSNPPYICEWERAEMASHVVDHEPATALFVPDDDPLRFYRALARSAVRCLAPEGRLMVEINERLGRETADCFAAEGLREVGVMNDDYGRERFVVAKK